MTKSRDLRVRSFEFAVDVVGAAQAFVRRDPVVRRLALQLVDAAGSVGANLEEAAEAQTKRDFIAKNFIALKEAREARFWLRLIGRSELALASRTNPLIAESTELIAMLVAAIRTARSNPERGRPMDHQD
jgi:four helix bundle protein